jgi:hypothetical protein
MRLDCKIPRGIHQDFHIYSEPFGHEFDIFGCCGKALDSVISCFIECIRSIGGVQE